MENTEEIEQIYSRKELSLLRKEMEDTEKEGE
jgi:hypothetical protein